MGYLTFFYAVNNKGIYWNNRQPVLKLYNCGKCKDRNWLIQCKCGNCNEVITLRTKYYIRKYKQGHNLKTIDHNGENNYFWNGGIAKTNNGYIKTYSPNHPYKQHDNYIHTHRLIYENYLSIIMDEDVYIPNNYDIHHINGVKTDNSLTNLQLVTRKEHMKIHMIGNKRNEKDKSNRICLICDSKKTYTRKNNHSSWYNYKDGFICDKCYVREKRNNRLIHS